MSRRTTREGQRLAQDLARVIQTRQADPRLMVDPAEARRIRQAAIQERKERRANSAVTLLLRQYMPWVAGGIVFAVGAVTWLLDWLSDDPLLPVAVAAFTVLAIAWTAWMAGHRTKRWRSRIHLAAMVASMWLLYAATTGPSWQSVLALALGVVVSSSSWWKANRIPHPKAPSPQPVPKTDTSIPVLWDQNVGCKTGAVPGSILTERDTSKPNCETYQVVLRAGQHTITFVLSQLERIAGGLSTPVKCIVLEPHPDENPNHMLLTVVRVSPIDKTLTYAGARITGPQRNIIEVGPYGDGDGMAPWRMWAPGEAPMTGSWLSGFIVGGTGIGKSRLMELLAAGYMAAGNAIVWFADPQGGASSPALKEYADWYVDSEGTPVMLAVLEQIAAARELENSVDGWTRFDPSPERPGIVVFLDECQVTFGKYGKRWADLARKTQKVGIAFVGLTQYAALESLGGQEPLRASLLANAIVMKANSNQNKNLIAGLEVNPETLPKIPGFGYVIGTDGTRTAPFRAEYLADPARWFERYPMPKLDELSANAAGDSYQMRRETQAELHESNRLKVEQMRGGTYQPPLDEPDLDDWGTPEPAAFKVVTFPSAPRPQDKPAPQRVLAAVAQGITRTEEIGKAVGLGKSQLHAVLKALVESCELEQQTRGVYAIAGSATPPER